MMNMFTKDEQVILKNVPNEYKWVARNESEELYVFEKKPKRGGDNYVAGYGTAFIRIIPFEHIFKKITFEVGPVQFRK